MSFTARIPPYIVFYKPVSTRTAVSNISWLAIPENSVHQVDIKKLRTDVRSWDYWGVAAAGAAPFANRHDAFVHTNEPCKLQLTGYHQQGAPWNGRQSIQVILPSGHVVGMPHDVFLRAIMTSGYKKKTRELPGTYVMVYVNRKLVPVQLKSGLHRAVLEHVKRSQKKSLTPQELTVGHIYTSAAGNTALFLGYVNTETIVVDTPPGVLRRINPRNFDRSTQLVDFGVRFLPKTLATLWYQTPIESWQGTKYTSQGIQNTLLSRISAQRTWPFQCKKQHKFVEVIPDYYVDVPDNIVMQIRTLCEQKLIDELNNRRSSRSYKLDYYDASTVVVNSKQPDIIRHYDAIHAMPYAANCNMTLFGMGIIRADVIKQFEPWETRTNKSKQKDSEKKK